MPWKPVVIYTYENHAALDESGRHNNGVVRLPAPDRWVDAPFPGTGTAIRYDNPQSQITIPPNPSLAGWAGFRVDVIFRPAHIAHRLNLVEGDGSFAFFIESDASLMGTVFDGTQWYQVKSAPGTIVPGRLYRAMFEYMPSSSLLLFLNGGLLTLQGSNGAAIRPVQANGIKVGYWPGGDDRYTYAGLMGPMAISTLDPYEDGVSAIGKFVCPALGARQDVFNMLARAAQSLTPSESAGTEAFFKSVLDAVWKTLGALVSTATDARHLAATLNTLSPRMDAVLVRNQQQGTSFFNDPEFFDLLQGATSLLDAAPLAKEVFFAQVMRATAAMPMSQSRVQEVLGPYAEAAACLGGVGRSIADPGNPVGGWVGRNVPGYPPAGWPNPGCPGSAGTGSGGTGGGPAGTAGSGCGCGGPGTSGASPGPGATPGTGPNPVHIHVHCCGDGTKTEQTS